MLNLEKMCGTVYNNCRSCGNLLCYSLALLNWEKLYCSTCGNACMVTRWSYGKALHHSLSMLVASGNVWWNVQTYFSISIMIPLLLMLMTGWWRQQGISRIWVVFYLNNNLTNRFRGILFHFLAIIDPHDSKKSL